MKLKNWKTNSLFSKLFFRFLILSLIIIIIFGLIIIYYIEDFLYNRRENEVLYNLNQLKNDLNQPLLEEDVIEINEILSLTARQNRGQIWLTDQEGNIIYSYPSRTEERVGFEGYQQIFDNKLLSSRVESDQFERPMLLNAASMEVEGTKYGLLFFTSVQGINSTVSQIQKIMFYLTLFSALPALLLAYLWARTISNPLKNISKTAEEISRGNFIELKNDHQTEELKNLAESINEMSKTLAQNMNNLKEEKNKLNYILSGMEEGVLALNPDQEIILLNQSFADVFISETAKPADPAQSLETLINNQQVITLIEESIAQKENKTLEIKIENSDKYLLLHSTAIFREGEFWGVVIIFQDISERWRFEKLQNDFVANVSHELKTPLSSIRGAAEIVYDGAVSRKKAKEKYLNMIIEESNRLETMVNNILSISELKSDILHQTRINFSQFLYNMLQDYKRVNDVEQDFVYQLEEDVEIELDADKIKRVVINLLDNAVKYSPPEGEITISLTESGSRVEFTVEDQGPGVPEAERKNIWERFYKINKKSFQSQKRGSGLGLAIVKDIIEMHGGSVYQKNLEQGSKFAFVLFK
ncbi:two-component system phosphate regulon sensor histidine kinase PhoR/two-component system sensor histidine kinase ResE [Halanaerobium saccharolyticum]|uniref:histidine kinase n=1 Tax=Halanaerobium saccharolyticum TaxID=43595 RepID=A0A4R7Z7E5_9FIRM|nr:ATP-binding protein [Halanaerobium saccharolyticum]RAK09847.1 two-component system phosphate regulon sensor histidine kinase PhoR/two-component system sensor histidine kinase ResE [Halanaerobium saccharolyticum]TDW07409.1 two-component system phosphate regulon sensor histidine kinase PhoR/two-component system sensor histidine kinase ResE [Halanaerobium saccharolyticum]TDX61288.1 two-component system phosphate regulon sensor histidine kinase PhoR/two-component system sensor histidine kinase Re